MTFKFAKEQRVNVPGSTAQGVVLDIVENIPGFPVYTITWLSDLGDKLLGSCGEGDLVAANLPAAIELAGKLKPLAFGKVRFARKRKPARKSKRRR